MKNINIGLAGLGVVGKGVYEILEKDSKALEKKLGTKVQVVAATARTKKDFIDETKVKFYENTLDLANDENIDIIVEVIGGNTIAKELCEAAIKKGKKIVTANKALIATHGFELAKLAEENNSSIAFESSTAAATPIIKAFKESFAGNEIKEFYGILNGTCNFILTKMEKENLNFDIVLKEAQELGYAEADPTFDIEGIDTAHKLAILSSIASLSKPDFDKLYIEGVTKITIDDINLAKDLGYVIKLLAIYKDLGDSTQQSVYPCLVKENEKIAQVDEAYNAILSDCSNALKSLVIGSGAGSLPTASAIVGDIADFASNRFSPIFGAKTDQLSESKINDISQREGKYFISLVLDKELAKKSDISKEVLGSINIEQSTMIDQGEEILGGFLTQSKKEQEIVEILNKIDINLVKSHKFIRVEETNF